MHSKRQYWNYKTSYATQSNNLSFKISFKLLFIKSNYLTICECFGICFGRLYK